MPNWFTLPNIIFNVLICLGIYGTYLINKEGLRRLLARPKVLYSFLLLGLLLIFSNYFTKSISFFGYDGDFMIIGLAYLFVILMLLYFVMEKWFLPILFYAYFGFGYYLLDSGRSFMMLPIVFGFAVCLGYAVFVTRRIDKKRSADEGIAPPKN